MGFGRAGPCGIPAAPLGDAPAHGWAGSGRFPMAAFAARARSAVGISAISCFLLGIGHPRRLFAQPGSPRP
jgi:hypothetical protein